MNAPPTLVIDGSGSRVFAGILDAGDVWLSTKLSEGAPLETLIPSVETVIEEAGMDVGTIRSFYYCEGPGSLLGLRLCAMAIETWRRLSDRSVELFAYNSLQLCAHILLQDKAAIEDALIIADWKKNAWNALIIRAGRPQSVTVVDDQAVASWKGLIYHLPQRKGWQRPPENVQRIDYNPRRLVEISSRDALLRATNEVELYNSGLNSFQKWTADRHRG